MYGRNDDLREQEFQLYGNYNLPFGHNQKFLSGVPNWVNYLRHRIPAKPVFELVKRSSLQSELWRVRIRHTERTLQPNKTVGIMPTNLTSFSTTSHSRTYFVPVPCFWPKRLDYWTVLPALPRYNSAMLNATATTGPSFFNTDLSAMKNTPIRENITPSSVWMLSMSSTTSVREIQETLASIALAPGSLPGWLSGAVTAPTGVLSDISF